MAPCTLEASKNAVQGLHRTFKKMCYQTQTGRDLSDQEYSNVINWVLGTLQGSGASPCRLQGHNCLLLGPLDEHARGITF